jgi:SAM-dependent methyltransferase
VELLSSGSRILDFGAGPCEKAAVLSRLGYQCTAIDDLQDDWHAIGNNRERVREFAKKQGIELIVADHLPMSLRQGQFDMVMIHDVIEHFADSPRSLLLDLIGALRSGGFLYITVPNAANLRKRLLVIGGQTNYPRYAAYFWSGDIWRGHKREYVKDDLAQLGKYLGLRQILLKGQHHRMRALPPWSRGLFKSTVGQVDSMRDTLAFIGQKPEDWNPVELTLEEYRHIRQRETNYHF